VCRAADRNSSDKERCTQALSVGSLRSLEPSAIACQPGCMTRGRYKQRKAAAERAAAVAAESDPSPPTHAPAGLVELDSPAPSPVVGVPGGSSFRRPRPLPDGETYVAETVRPTPRVKRLSATPWEKKRAQQADLRRLRDLSESLVQLHREEAKLLRERDSLIADLRDQGVPWSSLAMRTGLSRQALSKRAVARES
jgi:hypothetical protein